jgi:hypothetical protein
VEYSPLNDTKGDQLYRDTEEIQPFRAEAPIPTGRLQAPLQHLGTTSASSAGGVQGHRGDLLGA